ncbi:27_t:CDS:2, partial [Cetraspora pellucida]
IWRYRPWCIASEIRRCRSWCVASGIRRRFWCRSFWRFHYWTVANFTVEVVVIKLRAVILGAVIATSRALIGSSHLLSLWNSRFNCSALVVLSF